MSEMLVVGLDIGATAEEVEEVVQLLRARLPGVGVMVIAGASGMAVVHPRRQHEPKTVSTPSESG